MLTSYMDCPVCESKKNPVLYSDFPGYMNPSNYNIYSCKKCNTQFISTLNISSKIYKTIYNQVDTPGYQRYYKYAQKVKNLKNPLLFLSKQEPSYFPTYQFIKNVPTKLKILEVGCSYGYLTYSLNKTGHDSFGIDLSKNAVDFAINNFGNYYTLSSIENYKTKDKFDLIIANELIEHLKNPKKFVKICSNLLKEHGHIIITTPNKDYFPKKSIWRTDLPPVHTLWLSKKSIATLAKKHKLTCNFVNFSEYIGKNENILITFISSRVKRFNLPIPVIDENGEPDKARISRYNSNFRKILRIIFFSYPIRVLSHHIHYFINKNSPTIGAILTK